MELVAQRSVPQRSQTVASEGRASTLRVPSLGQPPLLVPEFGDSPYSFGFVDEGPFEEVSLGSQDVSSYKLKRANTVK